MHMDMYISSRDVQRFLYMILESYQEVQIQPAEKCREVPECCALSREADHSAEARTCMR